MKKIKKIRCFTVARKNGGKGMAFGYKKKGSWKKCVIEKKRVRGLSKVVALVMGQGEVVHSERGEEMWCEKAKERSK